MGYYSVSWNDCFQLPKQLKAIIPADRIATSGDSVVPNKVSTAHIYKNMLISYFLESQSVAVLLMYGMYWDD